MRSNAVKRIPVATHGIWDETAVSTTSTVTVELAVVVA